jgi:hypothetical protein
VTFLFSEASRPAVGSSKFSIRCVSRGSFPAVMRLGRDAGHLPLSSVEANAAPRRSILLCNVSY